MNHLYEDQNGLIHLCEGGEVVPNEYVVWTLCEIDVPANQSFKSKKLPTCPKCLKYNKSLNLTLTAIGHECIKDMRFMQVS